MAKKRVVSLGENLYFCRHMEDILDKSLVSDTSICNLLLRIGPGRLDAAIYSVVHDNSLIYRSFPLLTDSAGQLRSLEEAVYDNPLLLSEFRRIYCIMDTGNAMAVPSSIADEADIAKVFRALHPEFDGEVLTSATGTRNALLAYGAGTDLTGFLRRTFHGIGIDCHLSTLCRFFASRPGTGNTRRMVCNLRQDAVDVIVIHGSELLLANTFSFKTSMDAAYYIMAARKSLGLNPEADEILLSGDQHIREEITPVLRRFTCRVMPVIFPPQMFRTGKESLRAPFDLIISPICE